MKLRKKTTKTAKREGELNGKKGTQSQTFNEILQRIPTEVSANFTVIQSSNFY